MKINSTKVFIQSRNQECNLINSWIIKYNIQKNLIYKKLNGDKKPNQFQINLIGIEIAAK